MKTTRLDRIFGYVFGTGTNIVAREYTISDKSICSIWEEVAHLYCNCVHTPGSGASYKKINDILNSVMGGNE
jgi:hypothetical protein